MMRRTGRREYNEHKDTTNQQGMYSKYELPAPDTYNLPAELGANHGHAD